MDQRGRLIAGGAASSIDGWWNFGIQSTCFSGGGEGPGNLQVLIMIFPTSGYQGGGLVQPIFWCFLKVEAVHFNLLGPLGTGCWCWYRFLFDDKKKDTS